MRERHTKRISGRSRSEAGAERNVASRLANTEAIAAMLPGRKSGAWIVAMQGMLRAPPGIAKMGFCKQIPTSRNRIHG